MAELTNPDEHEPQPPAETAVSGIEPADNSTAFEVATGEADGALAEASGVRAEASSEGDPVPRPTTIAAPAASAQTAATAAAGDPKSKPAANGDSISETIKTVVYALLIALVIRTFFFQPFNIPSGSMENTLLVGDYLFVEKWAYGFSKYSFLFDFPPFKGRVFASEPHRGDVIVFRFPPEPSTDFIKRLIGLPGDTVQVINGQVWLNNKPLPRERVGEASVPDQYGMPKKVERFRETLPSGKSYYVLGHDITPADGALTGYPGDNTQLYVVPPGHYFMMGDNRENSADSRREVGSVGFVPAENLVGKAEFTFFSFDSQHPFWQFWYWPWEIRYSRMFNVID